MIPAMGSTRVRTLGVMSAGLAAVSSLAVGCSSGDASIGLESVSPATVTVPVPASPMDSAADAHPDSNEIATAFESLMLARETCGRDPRRCDVSRLAVEGSSIWHNLHDLMTERASAGIVASRRGQVRRRIESIDVQSATQAIVSTCIFDDTVLIVESAIFDDSLYSARSEWTMTKVADRWLWSGERVIDFRVDGDMCGGWT